MLLQRGVTAATRGDYVPLMRLAYDSLYIDPETQAAIPDPTYSDAMYYAVECQDYAYYPQAGDPTARLHAWVDDATKAGVPSLRLSSTYFGDAPVPVVAEHADGRSARPGPRRRAVPDVRPHRDARPGHARSPMRCASTGRLTDAYMFVQTRRSPRHLRPRACPARMTRSPPSSAPASCRRPGSRSATARSPIRLRRQPAAPAAGVPDREPVRDVDRGHAPQLGRLQLPVTARTRSPCGCDDWRRADVPRRLATGPGPNSPAAPTPRAWR